MIDLRLGDCLEVMKTIKDNSIDAIITDTPYGTTNCKWDGVIDFDLMWEQLNRIIKLNGAIVLFGAEPFSSALRMSNIKNYKYDWVWYKNTPTGHLNAKRQPMRAVENIIVFYKKQCLYNRQMIKRTEQELKRYSHKSTPKNKTFSGYGKHNARTPNRYDDLEKCPKNVLEFKVVHGCDIKKVSHPTQKPIELMEYLIKTYTNENETVLDFTMGSGSTGVACKNTNRNFIGIEKEQKYFKIAQERINSTLF